MSKYGTDATIKSLSGMTYTDLGLASSAAFDTLIAAMNTALSAMVDSYCRRDFNLHEDDTLKLRGTNSRLLVMNSRPIIAITSIKQSTNTIDSDTYFIRPVPNSSHLSGSVERLYEWWYYDLYYDIVYDWGFATVPEDVAQVVNQLTIYELRDALDKYQNGNVSSISMAGYAVTWGGSGSDVENNEHNRILSQLNNWRSVVMG